MNVADVNSTKTISFPHHSDFTADLFTLQLYRVADKTTTVLTDIASDSGISGCGPSIWFDVDLSSLEAGEYEVTLVHQSAVYGVKLLYIDSGNRDFNSLGSGELESVTILGS